MAKVVGYWEPDSDDGKFDDYMKAMGLNFAMRQLAKRVTAHLEIKKDGDEWVLEVTSTFKNQRLEFKLGVEFEVHTMDMRHVKTVFTEDDEHTLREYQTSTVNGVPDTLILRQRVDDDTLKLTLEAIGKGVTCIRIYKRVVKK